jgi:transketolase
MSVMDMLAILYYKYMKYDVENPNWEDRDRFILSKGHAGVALASLVCHVGFDDKEKLKTFNLSNSTMGIHLDSNKVKGVDASTGSLGHGLSIALGTALAAKVLGKDYKTFCILGDGECDEGSNWEAGMAAAHFKADNLISFVDRNKCMIDGRTEDVMKLEPLADKWRSFGFIVKEVDGHNFNELAEAIDFALENKGAPVMIIADTVKGAGVDYMEGDYKWHYGALNEEKYEQAKASLEKHYAQRVARAEKEGI